MISSRLWLFVLCCIALVTSAFTFVIRGDIFLPLGAEYNLSMEKLGGLTGYTFGGMAFAMLIGGFFADAIGVKRVMWMAFGCHLVGSSGFVFAPSIVPMLVSEGMSPEDSANFAYTYLCIVNFLMGCGNGMTEVGINPLVATMYAKQKTHWLNILHAWWPGGLVIGALGTTAIKDYFYPEFLAGGALGMQVWQVSLLLILVPTIVYGLMLIPSRFPPTERTAAGVSFFDMLSQLARPLFLIWCVCMLLTASTELSVQSWQESVLRSTAEMSGTLVVAYTAGMMFVLRHFAGPIVHRISPVGLLWVSAVLSAIGLCLLSGASTATTVMVAATIYGLGIAFFWPTMLGVTAERFPRGGALTLSLMGSVGNLAIAVTVTKLGAIADFYQVAYVKENAPQMAQVLLKQDEATGNFLSLETALVDRVVEAKGKGEAVAAPPELATVEATSEAADVAQRAKAYGFSWAFLWTALLPGVLVILFGGVWIYDWMRGGYKAEILITPEEENELFAGGAQGPIH